MMTLEKGMFTNKNNFTIFKEVYFKIADNNENLMNMQKFVSLMAKMASILFPGEANPTYAIVNCYLSDRHVVNEERCNFLLIKKSGKAESHGQ